MKKSSNKEDHYVDNEVLLEHIIEYKKECKIAEDKGEEKPPVTEFIGECITLISSGLAKRPNFVNYPYKSDMIGEGIFDCLKAVNNFDPQKAIDAGKKPKPFAYFTTICWYAFLRVIAKETKQEGLKYAIAKEQDTDGTISAWLATYEKDSDLSPEELQQKYEKMAAVPEKKKKTTIKKKESKSSGKLDDFMKDD